MSATGDTTSWTYDAAGNQTRDGSGFASSYGVRSQARYIGGKANTNFAVGNTERYGDGTGLNFDNGALGLMRRTDGSTTDQGYTRTPEGAALSYKSIDNKRFYYVTDHLGSVVGMFNSGGGYLGGYSYSPDGEERATGPNARIAENQLRYIGELYLGGGMYKFGARYYDASQARFTQTDPSGQEKNPYAYGACNPVNSKDPGGMVGCLAQTWDVLWNTTEFFFGTLTVVGAVYAIPDFYQYNVDLYESGQVGEDGHLVCTRW